MFPFLFFLTFFFSFCRICRDSIPLLVTVFSQAGYFSLACPSLSFGNLKKSQLLFRAVRGSIGVKNRPPGNGVGYNLVTEARPSPGRGWTGRSPGRVWGGTKSVQTGPGSLSELAPLIRQGLRPCHLKRGGRLPPAGASCGATFPQGKVGVRPRKSS